MKKHTDRRSLFNISKTVNNFQPDRRGMSIDLKGLIVIGLVVLLCTILVLGYLSGNFIPALIGVGFLMFMCMGMLIF